MKTKVITALCIIIIFMFICSSLALAQNHTVPILLYHCVIDGSIDIDSNVYITRDNFIAHMQVLRANGFTPISFDDYSNFSNGLCQLPDNPIIITFDDGYENNYSIAYPILKDFGFKATIFIVASTVGRHDLPNPHFTWDQAREMSESGLISIQSHGYAHTDISALPVEAAIIDLRLSRFLIEKAVGKPCNVLAYPYGFANGQTTAFAINAGYQIQCLTGDSGANTVQTPITALKRLTIKGYQSPEQFMSTIYENINLEQ